MGCQVSSARGAVAAALVLVSMALGASPGTGRSAAASRAARRGLFAPAYLEDVEDGRLAGAARSYWTAARLARARAWMSPARRMPAAHPVRGAAARSVGALFSHVTGGDHFCTASVVSSPGHDMLITAAHCIHGGKGRTYRRDVVFVPGYRHGEAPHGIWVPRTMIIASQWADYSDPALDVAFIVLQPLARRSIEDELGANRLGVNYGFHRVVRLTGYPAAGEAPITCVNRTSRQSRHQMRFACRGYSLGTSGSPWVVRFNSATHTGVVIGVIGGYQRGGDTSEVSYSPYFGSDILRLYEGAEAQS